MATFHDGNKYQTVRRQLIEALRADEFGGDRLPSDRDLAARYGVSYMTARRAVNSLAEDGLVERRARAGTFVRAQSRERLALPTVNIICSMFVSASIEELIRLSQRTIEQNGWQAQLFRINRHQTHAAAQLVRSGDMALVMTEETDLSPALIEAMREANGRAVLLGNRMEHLGIASVLCDDARAIRSGVEYLQAHGHSAIALLVDSVEGLNERVQVAAWRVAMTPLAAPQLLGDWMIDIKTPRLENRADHAHRAVTEFLKSHPEITAIVSLTDDMTVAAMAACRALGRRVPEDISIVNSGNAPLMALANPPVTCIDVDLKKHADHAIRFLKRHRDGTLDDDRLSLIEPHLIARESVAAAPSPKK